MSTYELHNFIEDYPCQDDRDIQWNIASRKEFNELISDKDKLEKVDRFFKHQQLFLRYLRQYDRIFNIQATGTGKSGTAINAAEYFKKSGGNIKRVYVLQPGPATKEDFKNQIQKLSDPDEYVNDKIKYSMSKTSYNNNLTRLIKEWYTIETYREFTKKNYSDQLIIEEFSDCLFFFDEAHLIRNTSDDGTTAGKNEFDKIYNFLWRVTHLAQRSKIIVGTATPLVNDINDFVLLMNLLLPMDRQLPSGDSVRKDFYDTVTLDQLEPYFRGKITFIKFSEAKINVLNRGETLDYLKHEIEIPYAKNKNEIKPTEKKIEGGKIVTLKNPRQEYNEMRNITVASQTKLTNLEMQSIQLETYKAVRGKRKGFRQAELETSVFVYPNGDYGVKGFEKYVYIDDLGEYQFRDFFNDKKKVVKGLLSLISEKNLTASLENIKLMSSKFHFYIQKEFEASKNEKPGNSFCYIEFDKASGATLLGMILRVFGFEEYKTNFTPKDLKTGKILLNKRKRFFILSGDTKNIQDTLNFFNSEENRYGEYIQLIIATKRAQVGINVKNVRRGYIMTPGWHESGMYQALSRFIRADSHDMLYRDLGDKVEVEIFRLNSTLPKGISTDEELYRLAERKDIRFKRIIRFMKQCAFDAFLNYDRNINLPPGSKDGSSIADYDVKNFRIYSAQGAPGNSKRKGMALNQGPNSGDYIYNTYNLLYSQNLIVKVKERIRVIIKDKITITIEEIREELGFKVTDYIFNSALEELIFNKEIISNKQNTLYYNLDYTSNLLYLTRESYYQTDRISTENSLVLDTNFPVIEKELELVGEKKTRVLDKFYEEFSNLDYLQLKDYYIQNQDYLLFKTLIEDSLVKLREKKTSKINSEILKLASNYILIVKKPTSYIEEANNALKDEGKSKQGRKRTADSTVGLTKLNLDKVKDIRSQETVYLHFYKDTGQSAFSINSLFRTTNKSIRILEDGKDKFRDADNAENFVYNYLFEKEYQKIFDKFEKSKYYAMVIYRSPQGSIVEKEKQFFRIIDNGDKGNRGKVCTYYDINVLIKILRYLDTEGKYKKLLEKKVKKPVICPILEKLFKEKDLMFSSI